MFTLVFHASTQFSLFFPKANMTGLFCVLIFYPLFDNLVATIFVFIYFKNPVVILFYKTMFFNNILIRNCTVLFDSLFYVRPSDFSV